ELAQHVTRECGVLPQPFLCTRGRMPHACAQERQRLDRPDEGAPLDELPLVPDQAVELAAVVRPEPAPGNEVLRRRDARDRIDLQEAEPAYKREQIGRRAVEQLRV